MSRYNFAFYTGYGYREIAPHTIKAYYLPINADNDQEAIKKLDRKRNSLIRFNEAFRNDKCGVEIRDNKKVGCCFIGDNIIKWQKEMVLSSPQVFGLEPRWREIHTTKYIFDGEWVLRNVLTSIYPSFTSWFNYVWDRMGGNGNLITSFDIKEELQKYYYTPLNKMSLSSIYSKEEKEEFSHLLKRIYEKRN